MRIHSDVITVNDLHAAARNVPGGEVYMHCHTEHGSRKRAHAFEVQLRGSGARHTKRPNPGTGPRNDTGMAATYDDWGWFLAALYLIDGNMRATYYENRADFDERTRFQFVIEAAVR